MRLVRQAGLESARSILKQTYSGLIVSKQALRKIAALELVRSKRETANQTLGFASRPFVLCGLPVKRPPKGQLLHERRNGHFVLSWRHYSLVRPVVPGIPHLVCAHGLDGDRTGPVHAPELHLALGPRFGAQVRWPASAPRSPRSPFDNARLTPPPSGVLQEVHPSGNPPLRGSKVAALEASTPAAVLRVGRCVASTVSEPFSVWPKVPDAPSIRGFSKNIKHSVCLS